MVNKINIQVQEAQRVPDRMNPKRPTARHINIKMPVVKYKENLKSSKRRNQDGGVGRHTAPPRTTRTDRESNSKGDRHQGHRK